MNSLMYKIDAEECRIIAQIISEMTEEEAIYDEITLSYKIGPYSISENGALSWTDDVTTREMNEIGTGLRMVGFLPNCRPRLVRKDRKKLFHLPYFRAHQIRRRQNQTK